jgi:hypothetical protein
MLSAKNSYPCNGFVTVPNEEPTPALRLLTTHIQSPHNIPEDAGNPHDAEAWLSKNLRTFLEFLFLIFKLKYNHTECTRLNLQ